MKNKNFIVIFTIMFILFAAVFGSAGCTGRSHSRFINDNHDGSDPNPDLTPNSTFTVTFDSNGGSEVPSQEIEAGGTVILPDNPTKDGYVFAGWYKDNETFNDMFIFGESGDKVTQDITLYAQWIEYDTLITDYAINEVTIGYSKGDNANHVTGNLTLPTKIYSADISWVSSSSAISSNGTVTRQATDTDVTLTATANYSGKESESKTFTVKVIRKRTRNNSEIKPIPIDEAKSGDITITRNASGDVTAIEGMYVSFDISNADDALDAVTVIKNELGIRNPANELEIFCVTSDKYGAKYQFQQVHNGVKVFGCSVTVSTNYKSKGNFIHSYLLSSDIIAKADGKSDVGQSSAENKAKANYTGDVVVDTASTEKIIYSLGDDYGADPVYAYMMNVSGINGDGQFISEKVFIDASTCAVIDSFSNIRSNSVNVKRMSGIDELENPVDFNVFLVEYSGTTSYLMSGNDPRVQMYLENVNLPIIRSVGTIWNDGQSISAYINMCEVINWWKEKFHRNSLDGKGKMVKVVTHAGKKSDAHWDPNLEAIVIFDMPDDMVENYYSYAVATDVLVHETTHAVNEYDIPGGLQYKNITGAIDEAYADIFACVKDTNWRVGEAHYKPESGFACLRNISNPDDTDASETSERHAPHNLNEHFPYTTDSNYDKVNGDHGGVHKNSFIISRTAYLMHEAYAGKNAGLTWEELGNVWYKSISGLSAKSTFHDVRTLVTNAAKEMSLSQTKIATIEGAFDEVGITFLPTPGPKPIDPIAGVPIDEKHFPDSIFRDYVKQFDTNGDNILSTAEREKVIHIDVHGHYYISSLVGIEYFTVLQTLSCSSQQLTALDVSKNTALQDLRCYGNQLTTLNVSGCTALQDLRCYDNQLTTLNVSSCTALQDLHCYDNQLTTLNISGCTALTNLYCDDNQLTTLDVSGCNSLQGLDCINNQLIDLDVSKNTALVWLYCDNNQLTTLNVSGCNSLQDLRCCDNNQLTTLDISGCTALTNLDCYNNNQLTTLNASGCNSLQRLYCIDNQLTTLDISGCNSLQGLECYNNQLATLNVNGCNSLQVLNCINNQLTTLNVSGCNYLQYLYCYNNQLTTLNASGCNSLRILSCYNNQLTTLDVSGCNYLQYLYCYNNQLTTLDLSSCPNLSASHVECDSGVAITWPSSSSSSSPTSSPSENSSHSSTSHTNGKNALEILAYIPVFTAEYSGTYVFNVSLDKKISDDTKLILLSLSDDEDYSGEFENLDNLSDSVRVSAQFEAGITYAPVIVAQSGENAGSSGGCNAGMFGFIILLANLVFLRKR